MTFGNEHRGTNLRDFKSKENMANPNFTKSSSARADVITESAAKKELGEPRLEQEGDLANLQRVMRDLQFADMLDVARTKSKTMTPGEQSQITNSIDRRKWGGILKNLQKGDTVVSILSSTSDLLSIKNLNDNIFGSQTTDGIIAKRRQLTESIFKRALIMTNLPAEDLYHVSLEQNYKFGTFKIPGQHNIDVVAIAKQVCAEVDLEMTKFIIKLADEEQTKAPKKTAILQNFRGAVNAEGYKMTFGSATVESDNLQDIILAMNGSLQTARAIAFDNPKDYGDQFSSEKMTAIINQINEIKNKLHQGGNKIIGKDGISHEIFLENNGRLELNKDLLREVRKDKFICKEDQTKILKELKYYIKSLNIFDVVKPFAADEIDKIKKELEQMGLVTAGVAEGKQDNYIQAADILDRNEKDERFTSEARFHSEAVKIKNCAYLSLDVLDVGIDQLLDFEQRAQSVASKETTFAQASLEAGDLMTKKLRQVREQAYKICEEFKITKNERMNGLVGGDELTLAIDLDAVDENGNKIFDSNDKILNKLIHRLKKETNSRVVKTVIAESRRHSSSDNIIERTKEHLIALKNAEEGTKQAKQIEDELRELNKFVKKHPGNVQAKDLLNNLKDFVVTEVDDHFVIRTETGPDITLDQFLEKLKSFYD